MTNDNKEEETENHNTSDTNGDPNNAPKNNLTPTNITINNRGGIFANISTKTHAVTAVGLGILSFIILLIFAGTIVIMVVVIQDSVVGLVFLSILAVILIILFVCTVIGTIQQIKDYKELKKRNIIGIQFYNSRDIGTLPTYNQNNEIKDIYVDNLSSENKVQLLQNSESRNPTPMLQAYSPSKHFYQVQPCPVRPYNILHTPEHNSSQNKGHHSNSLPPGFHPAPSIIPQTNVTMGYLSPFYLPNMSQGPIPQPFTPLCNNPPPSRNGDKEKNPNTKLDTNNKKRAHSTTKKSVTK